MNRAISNAWNEHVRLYPKSRKRVLFACALILAFMSPLARQLWLMLH
jgi:hypothetical protein